MQSIYMLYVIFYIYVRFIHIENSISMIHTLFQNQDNLDIPENIYVLTPSLASFVDIMTIFPD